MSTVHIKIKHKEESVIFVKDLRKSDVFTVKGCNLSIAYMVTKETVGSENSMVVNLGTGEVRQLAGYVEVGEKFSKVEIILTPM